MLFDTIDEGFCIIEMIFDEHEHPVDFRYLEVNPSFEKQTGLKDAQGKRIRELAPKLEDYWFEIYGKIALTGEPARFQNHAEELHRWYDVYAFRFGQPENRQVAVLFNDVTERRQAEEALQASEKRYRMLFDTIDEGFCIAEMIFDEHERPVDYRFLEINPSFEKQTGLIDAKGKRIRELAPLHEEHWFEIYGKIALTGEPARFQNLAEELHRWYDVYAFRFGQPEDRQVAILFNDITERKRTEEALRESEEKFRLLVDSAQDYAIIMLDIDGRVASWNEGAQRMKLYTAPEIIGKAFFAFLFRGRYQKRKARA